MVILNAFLDVDPVWHIAFLVTAIFVALAMLVPRRRAGLVAIGLAPPVLMFAARFGTSLLGYPDARLFIVFLIAFFASAIVTGLAVGGLVRLLRLRRGRALR